MNKTTIHTALGFVNVSVVPAEDEDECARLGLQRVFEARLVSGDVIWSGEAENIEKACERACAAGGGEA